jgi:hypothetical protein
VTAAAWWSPADDAELAVLVRVLVDEVFDHRAKGCAHCGDGNCPAVRGAIEAAVEWAELRSAHSFACAMRRLQNQLENEMAA